MGVNKILLVIILSLFSVLSVGCANKVNILDETKISKDDSMELEEIKQKIVFIFQYKNWSDTFQHRGYYIDSEGNKVEYDLSTEEQYYVEVPKLLSYLESQEDVISEPCLNKDELILYYNWLLNISTDYTLEEISQGADQGSYCSYGIRYDEEGELIPILLAEDGDWIRTNTDPYAIKLAEILEKIK